MRILRVALLAALVAPGAAQAAPLASFAAHELPLRGGGLATSRARFDLVGLHWRGSGTVVFRTHAVAGRWSAWHAAAPEAEDLPNVASPESRPDAGWRIGNPWWAGPSDALQVRTRGPVTRVRSYLVTSSAPEVPARTLSIAGSPPIIMRAAWRADESIRRAPPVYAPTLQLAVIHHTAGTNTYTRAQSAAIVRGIEIYHVEGNGWNDIGYNFLVDKYGQVFEGRYGGIEKNVVGAHAEGFNTGSVGIALIGNYNSASPTQAQLAAVAKLVAWRLDLAHVDPLSTTTYISNGNPKFPADVPVFLRTVSGHRDTGYTDCPGTNLYAKLASIATAAHNAGLPKIFAPSVQGKVGGQVRFTAKLSSFLPWTITVLDPAGNSVDAGTGADTAIDWTWDASAAPPGKYTYEIDAGDSRPVTGVVGGPQTTPAAPLTLTASPAGAVLSPNGDGRGDSMTVKWAISATAQVSATVLDQSGLQVATLLDAQRAAGKYALTWRGSSLPDGRYTVQLSAVGASGALATATVPVLLDRTLVGLTGSSHYLSPNGDGKLDKVGFSFSLGVPAHVKLRLLQGGDDVGTIYEGDLQAGPQRLVWDGSLGGIPLADGAYQAVVSVTDAVGTVSQGANVALDTTPPQLQIVSGPKLRFRLSEPATVRFTIDGKHVVKVEKAGVFHVPHRGLATRFTAFATDPAGNQGAVIHLP